MYASKKFRCGYEDNLIAKFPKPPKYNEKLLKQVRLNEKCNCACTNGKNNSDQKIYASMARMSGNDKCPSGNFGYSSQLTNWILDSGATCHMIPEVSDFIPSFLEDTDKHIEVVERHHITEKQKGQSQRKCVTMMDILLSQRYTAYSWHQIYTTGYFQ